MPQFEKVTQQIIIVTGTVGAPMPINQYVSQYLAFPYGNYWDPLGWLLLFIVVVRILVILATEKVRLRSALCFLLFSLLTLLCSLMIRCRSSSDKLDPASFELAATCTYPNPSFNFLEPYLSVLVSSFFC